jgi:glutathione transport system substrate-binding protein
LSPVDFGYDSRIAPYGFDPQKARSLLAEAGYADGFTLNIAVQESQINIIQAIQGMWANINVGLNIRRMETGVFAQAIFGSPEQKAAQDLQCVFASWASASLDPENQLGPLYRTQSWSPSGANLGFYSNRQLDRLLDDAAAELDSEKRKGFYSQAQRMITDDAPHVFLYYSTDLAARKHMLQHFWLFPGGEIEPD